MKSLLKLTAFLVFIGGGVALMQYLGRDTARPSEVATAAAASERKVMLDWEVPGTTFTCLNPDKFQQCEFFWTAFLKQMAPGNPSQAGVRRVSFDVGCTVWNGPFCSGENAVASIYMKGSDIPLTTARTGRGLELASELASESARAVRIYVGK